MRTGFSFSAIAVGVLAFGSAVAVEAKDSPLTPIEDDPALPRALLIGDSISIGYTLPTRALLAGKANVHRPPTNCGNTTTCLRNIETWLGEGKWDVIHFNFGIHDIKCPKRDGVNQTAIETYEANLRKIVARLKKTGAVLVWCSTTQSPEAVCGAPAVDFVTYNAVARKVMEESDVRINDLYAFSLPRLKEIQKPVNSHFHAEGSKVLAGQVAEAVQAALATRVAE
ncbi:MAG: SGNH/GDSL hydrolase family protein [Lentisphaerae bacterium]|nr:SGNH/GDSL hydrolase family protein [Lentisphaerota bacterium]MBT5605525.1 SGNH/GDSL hydrolase family protein [Lentisphaerota bacterium]MBT7056802.1 SGNH/GDSL hydrolase family protein [Lentisphaerota bacterium]MBT7845412.1 SGNH/GDSL hydrolase family protein [Lentisphaerota bacterium]